VGTDLYGESKGARVTEASPSAGTATAQHDFAPVDREALRTQVESFIRWLDRFGERSYDPYDFWAWRPGRKAKRLYYRSPFAGILAVGPLIALDTLLPRSRRFVASPRRYPIADAHYASGFFHWARANRDTEAAERGVHFLEELEQSRCAGFDELCWGYPFDWESRSGTIPAGTPLITTVPYAYEAYELGYEATNEPRFLHAMESIAKFAFQQIPVTEFKDGSAAAAYTPSLRTTVVNASCYRGFLLATAAQRFGRPEWADEGERNIAFALAAQRRDGSWPYATMKGDEFVDNFHTCLVLKNLFKYWRIVERPELLEAVRRGYSFYRRSLLDAKLQPLPFAIKPRLTLHRRDLYDYAEGINLAILLQAHEPTAPDVLTAMVVGLLENWTRADGHFVTRQLLIGRNTVPYHRWAQSQVFHALTHCCRDES
jgi:hypothetical protein